MDTPILDFVNNYAENKTSRFHMPGHKGANFIGCEKFDITEFDGADVLYSPNGIISKSEDNATCRFNTLHTFYSAEGSTLAIKAMLALAIQNANDRPLIFAGRNAHKAFLHASVLLDFDIKWLYPEKAESYLSAFISREYLDRELENAEKKPCAVFITSPDYLGNLADIKGLASVCKKHGVPLLVDNAHGAYLKFLSEDLHPITLGATACADSAHKTLPVLTGGAYLHIGYDAPKNFIQNARQQLALFASTSPSYLILSSLDKFNAIDDFSEKLKDCIELVGNIKKELKNKGVVIENGEPLKIVINANASGYSGVNLAKKLLRNGVTVEFYDEEFVVLMPSPYNDKEDFDRLKKCFSTFTKKPAIQNKIAPVKTEIALSAKKAYFSTKTEVLLSNALGKIYGETTFSCPPAVPVICLGEVINDDAILALEKLGVKKVKVVK